MHRSVAGIAFLLLAFCSASSAGTVFLVPSERSDDPPFKCIIARNYANSQEAELLRRTEHLRPYEGHTRSARCRKQCPHDRQARWWYDTFDEVRLPQAVTADALQYYRDLVHALRAKRDGLPVRVTDAGLTYNASVAEHAAFIIEDRVFEDVFVVTLELRWGMYCGGECGLWFRQRRVAIFDATNQLVAVYYDGPVVAAVS